MGKTTSGANTDPWDVDAARDGLPGDLLSPRMVDTDDVLAASPNLGNSFEADLDEYPFSTRA